MSVEEAMRCSVDCLIVFGNFFLLDQAIQIATDGRNGLFQGRLLNVYERNIESRLRKHMRDAISHGSSANDGNIFHGWDEDYFDFPALAVDFWTIAFF